MEETLGMELEETEEGIELDRNCEVSWTEFIKETRNMMERIRGRIL